jgi:hypothetical protein
VCRLRVRIQRRKPYQIVHRQSELQEPRVNPKTNIKRNDTHPSSVLDELLAINLIQSRNSHIIPLGIHQPAPQLIILPSHRLQRDLGTRRCGIRYGQPTPWLLLLRESQRRELPIKFIHMRLRFSLKGVFQLDLFFSELHGDDEDVRDGVPPIRYRVRACSSLRERTLMMRSSSASYALMSSSCLTLGLVDDRRRIGGENDMI